MLSFCLKSKTDKKNKNRKISQTSDEGIVINNKVM